MVLDPLQHLHKTTSPSLGNINNLPNMEKSTQNEAKLYNKCVQNKRLRQKNPTKITKVKINNLSNIVSYFY